MTYELAIVYCNAGDVKHAKYNNIQILEFARKQDAETALKAFISIAKRGNNPKINSLSLFDRHAKRQLYYKRFYCCGFDENGNLKIEKGDF